MPRYSSGGRERRARRVPIGHQGQVGRLQQPVRRPGPEQGADPVLARTSVRSPPLPDVCRDRDDPLPLGRRRGLGSPQRFQPALGLHPVHDVRHGEEEEERDQHQGHDRTTPGGRGADETDAPSPDGRGRGVHGGHGRHRTSATPVRRHACPPLGHPWSEGRTCRAPAVASGHEPGRWTRDNPDGAPGGPARGRRRAVGLVADDRACGRAGPARGARPLSPGVTFLVGENGSGKSTRSRPWRWRSGWRPRAGRRTPRRGRARPSRRCTAGSRSSGPWAPRAGGSSSGPRRCTGTSPASRSTPTTRDPRFHEMSHGGGDRSLPCCAPVSTPRPVLPRRARGRPVVLRPGRPRRRPPRRRRLRGPGPVRHPLPAAGRPARRPPARGGPLGLRETRWEDLELVGHWRAYLDDPRRYLRHVLDD